MVVRTKRILMAIVLTVMLASSVYGCTPPTDTAIAPTKAITPTPSVEPSEQWSVSPTPPASTPTPGQGIFYPTPQWVYNDPPTPPYFVFPDLVFLIDESQSMKGSRGEEYRIPFFFLNLMQKLNIRQAGNDVNVSIIYLDNPLTTKVSGEGPLASTELLSQLDLSGLENKITNRPTFSYFYDHTKLIDWFIKHPPQRRTVLVWLTDGTINQDDGGWNTAAYDPLSRTLEKLPQKETKEISNLEMFVFLIKAERVLPASLRYFWRGVDSIPGVHVQNLAEQPHVAALKYFFQILLTPYNGLTDMPNSQDFGTPSFDGWRIFENRGANCGDGGNLNPFPPNLYTGDSPAPKTLFLSFNNPKESLSVNLDLNSKKTHLCSTKEGKIDNNVPALCNNDGIYFYWWQTTGFGLEIGSPEKEENTLICNNSNSDEENVVRLHASVQVPGFEDWKEEEWTYVKKCVYPILSLASAGQNRWLDQKLLTSSQIEFEIKDLFTNLPASLSDEYGIYLRGTDCEKGEGENCFQNTLELRYYPVYKSASVDENTVTFQFSYLDDRNYTSEVVKDNDHLQWPLVKFSHYPDQEDENEGEGEQTPGSATYSNKCGLGTELKFEDSLQTLNPTDHQGVMLVEKEDALKITFSDPHRMGCNLIKLYWEDDSWMESCGQGKLTPIWFLLKWEPKSGTTEASQEWVLESVEQLADGQYHADD